ncbi:MAG TPA: uroporphyrinogen-III synthase [Thermoleophilia bacterium]|nr:uroporphyrinogen-III synthase [Thermoleophilia bacterium]
MAEHPLLGKSVVVTRPEEQAGALVEPLENLGAEVLLVPTIRIVPVPLNDEIRAAVARLSTYQLVIFTSANGVAEFLACMRECGAGPDALAGATVAAVGPRTAAALAAHGVTAGIVPEESVAEGLLDALEAEGRGRPAAAGRAPVVAGSAGVSASASTQPARATPLRVLFPRARKAREVLPDTLREWGATVDVLPVYDTVAVERLALPFARIAAADYLTFTSASTVERFVELAERALRAAERPGVAGEDGGGAAAEEGEGAAAEASEGAGRPLAERLAGARIATIGPATSEAVRAQGLTVAVEAAEHDVHGLVAAIVADAAS